MDTSIPLRQAAERKKVANLENPVPRNKTNTWRILLVVVLLGLAVNLLLPQIANLKDSLLVLQQMTWWAVGLAFVAEAGAYLLYGYCLQAILGIHQQKLNVFRGALIALSSYSIGLVAGGWVASMAATFGFVKKEGGDSTTATMASLLPAMLMNAAIMLVSIIGIIFLFVMQRLSQSQLLQYTIFLILLALFTFGALIGLKFPKTAFKVTNWVMWHWNRLRKKPYNPADTQKSLDAFIMSWKNLSGGNWLKPMLGAFGYIALDMLCMFFLFTAAGHSINIGVLAAGYGLPLLLAKMAFLFPGGIGVVEASMAALFTSQGVPDGISVVVIIGYRLISFWIPTLLGFATAGLLSRQNNHAPEKMLLEASAALPASDLDPAKDKPAE